MNLVVIVMACILYGYGSSENSGNRSTTWEEREHTHFSDLKSDLPAYNKTGISYLKSEEELLKVTFGEPEKMNGDWKFILEEVHNGHSSQLNDSKWQQVTLPHDWSVKGQLSPTLASCTGYLPGGIGWYRKTIDIPAGKEGEKVYLYFEGVYNRSEVYVNGNLLGKRPNGYVSFMYDATPFIKYGEENLVAVRVDHGQSADSRWYTGSGIYRDVWLIYAHPLHIAQWGVYAWPEESKNGFKLNVEVEIDNGKKSTEQVTVVNELYSPDDKLVAKDTKKFSASPGTNNKITTVLHLKKPLLWSISNPNLYALKTTVYHNGVEIDKSFTTTGFRTYTFDPDKGFALNGEWMKMKGVCLHHDAGVLGAAIPRDVLRRRLQTLKEVGVNAIRTSHNPQSTDLYRLCDELGMLVLNEMYDEWEFPKRKWIEGWNVGTPGFQGSYDIFKEWSEKDLGDLVKRDRNHVSVFAWSIGNEVDYPNDPYSHRVLGGEKAGGFTQSTYGGYNPEAPDAMALGNIAKRLVKTVKEYDRSRPVTAGLAGVAMSNETEYPGALDIAGYNYTENRYDTDHEKYPGRVIYGSENRHDMAAWKATRDREHIFGQFLWTGIDYLGESGRWPSRGFYSGLLDFGGFIKPRGYFRQSLWSDTPMAYLGTYPTPGMGSQTQSKDVFSQHEAMSNDHVEKVPSMDAWPVWNYSQGQLIRVVCYTNADKAKLLLNGTEVGEIREYNDDTGIIFWDIPYKPGKLEVVGLDKNNRPVSGYAIQTSKRPHALRIAESDQSINSNGGVAHVVIEVVDEDGHPVFLSDNEITCHVSGPARLLGLEASNNTDMSDYTDNKHRVFNGRILAYIQTVGEGDDDTINIRFTSPWLEPAAVDINVK